MQAPTAGLARRAAAPPSITAEALLPLLPPSAEGVLFKRGQLLKGWSPGRYELKGSLLLFYKNGQLSRSVPLHGYRAHLRTDVRAPHGEVLVLRHQSDPQQRDYWFCVPTAAAAGVAGTSLGPAVPRGLAPPNVRSGQEWVDALNTAAAAAALTPADFEVLCEIGTGAYGKVSLVRKRGSLALLALKEIRKDAAPHMPRLDSESPEQHVDRVRHKNSKNMMWVMGERSSLQAVGQHPYVAALQYAFETDDCWFLALDFVPGGDLFDHAFVQEQKRFSEAVVRVWAAELVCVLEFIHRCVRRLVFVPRALSVLVAQSWHRTPRHQAGESPARPRGPRASGRLRLLVPPCAWRACAHILWHQVLWCVPAREPRACGDP